MKTGMVALLLFVSVMSAGCALNGYQTIKPADYPAVHQMFDVTFGWKKTIAESGVTIDGYVRNNRYFIISEMDMTVSLVDGSGREKAHDNFIFIPTRLAMDTHAGFNVALKAQPQPGDMIRFLYRYVALDGKEDALQWRNSFEIPAL
ncbi:MAG: hypothetical protein HXX11_13520 [Desulfuromonadales bacterium]|nr:hypothetical protein [Desulfuromonadales bacterium]